MIKLSHRLIIVAICILQKKLCSSSLIFLLWNKTFYLLRFESICQRKSLEQITNNFSTIISIQNCKILRIFLFQMLNIFLQNFEKNRMKGSNSLKLSSIKGNLRKLFVFYTLKKISKTWIRLLPLFFFDRQIIITKILSIDFLSQFNQSLFHLIRCLVGKGYTENSLWTNIEPPNQIRNFIGQNSCLSTSSPSNNKWGSIGM